jgi:predicted nucleic acid-binding protein
MSKRTKIVLDSDVIIHFIKGGQLPMIHQIFPEFQYVILDTVLDKELRKYDTTRQYLDKYLIFFKENIEVVEWDPDYQMTKEYTLLTKKFGIGESACMIYCKYNQDVIASSNIKDITEYCTDNNITWITTMDFLWQAYKRKLLSEKECDNFIQNVISNGSKLPVKKINDFVPRLLF